MKSLSSPQLSIDFETASVADLKRVGAYLYACDASTKVLCMAFAFDDGPVSLWRIGDPFPTRVWYHISNGGVVRAWNANFEINIWNHTLIRQLRTRQVYTPLPKLAPHHVADTMADAAYWGLPLKLDDAARALKVPHQKDAAGHALMLKMCKPCGTDVVTGSHVWLHEIDPQKFDALCAYCVKDVEAERAIHKALKYSRPPTEQHAWTVDSEINLRGVGIDIPFVKQLKNLAEQATQRGNMDIFTLTGGRVCSVNQTKLLLAWLQEQGYPYDNLQRANVEQRLEDGENLSRLEREGLNLRADVARTSAAKLNSMLSAADQDGTVRGMLQFYGATRTGRWAGRLVQLQNLPRGLFDNVDGAIEAIKSGADYDTIEALYGPVMGVVATCLRGCIVSRPGKTLVVADYSQIEARVVAWLAGQDDILQVFASGQDAYAYTASLVTGTPVKLITKKSPIRQLGKVLVLACGFGMSALKFLDTAAKSKVTLTVQEATQAVAAWRTANSKIVDFWWACDRAAKQAILNPGTFIDVGFVRFGMVENNLIVVLPSGRHLCYRDAQLRDNPDRPTSEEITYMGVDQYTRKWARLRTYGGKLVENVTQAVARDGLRDIILGEDQNVVLTVHDELILEVEDHKADDALSDLLIKMSKPPVWARGLPVAGEGWTGKRYKK